MRQRYSAQQAHAQVALLQTHSPVSQQSGVQSQTSQAHFAPQQQLTEETLALGAKKARAEAAIKLKNMDMVKPFA
jgi:hypothetical protein